MDNTDLIKTVRGLDQNGPGENGENIQSIWNLLVASPQNNFHAAEESSLRWLLKSMNGSSESAEKMRRYPLTWTIIDYVLQKMPLFLVAKSLADRKFLSVLQHTLNDLANPVESTHKSLLTKRKRSTSTFSIDVLRSQQGCIDTAQYLFVSLKRLLDRLGDTTELFSRDKLGAEHIRSLLCTSALDATAIAVPALRICQQLLSDGMAKNVTGSECWIQVVTSIWDLHLQGPDDVIQVAAHIFQPAAVILKELGVFKSLNSAFVQDKFKQSWLLDLQHFMHRNLALPCRAAFMNNREIGAFKTALISCRDMKDVAVPALYFISSSAYKGMVEGGSLRDDVEWIKQVFQLIEHVIADQPDRNFLMQNILNQALESLTPISVVDLRRICQEYALHKPGTDWLLVAKIVRCDTDVLQLSEQGIQLRKDICERISSKENDTDDNSVIVEVIEAMRDGFRTRRDMAGFLQLWFEQLCETENQKLQEKSPWFAVGHIWLSQRHSLQEFLETEMSPQRLVETVAWVKDNSSASNPQAISVFAATIAQSVYSEQYTNAIGQQLFDLVDGIKTSSALCALRWRVISAAATWVSPSERGSIWARVKKRLTKTAEKSSLLTTESYEAFKCCCRFWEIFSPDDAHIEEAGSLVEVWTQRLATKMSPTKVFQETSILPFSINAAFNKNIGHQHYISWILHGSTRFVKLYFTKFKKLPSVLANSQLLPKSGIAGLATFWDALLSNDISFSDSSLTRSLTDRLITALDESQAKNFWLGENGQMWMKVLSTLPLDSLDRRQRERIMKILARGQSSVAKLSADVDLSAWRLLLGLSAKIMKRSTFYDGLGFSDLVGCSEALSDTLIFYNGGEELLLEFIERFTAMATAILKQMANHVDERSLKYFREASNFLSTCEKRIEADKAGTIDLAAFHITLFKCLGTELSDSANALSRMELDALLKQTQEVTGKCITKVIISCASCKKSLAMIDKPLEHLILTATEAAIAIPKSFDYSELQTSSICQIESCAREAMRDGNIKAWKLHTFLQKLPSTVFRAPQLTSFNDLGNLPGSRQESLLKELVKTITHKMDAQSKLGFLSGLVDGYINGCDTDGQLLAIEQVVSELLDSSEFLVRTQDGCNLSMVHSELCSALLKQAPHPFIICRLLRTLLEKRPQCMSQWNIEITLSVVSRFASVHASNQHAPSFSWLCKLFEVIIKKHRIRLEGHFHLVVSTMQVLLRNLIIRQSPLWKDHKDTVTQEAKAHLYARLITLICEPTAGAVSRSQLHSSLDLVTDAAKRSAGRHMYLILVQYVKLQLETNLSMPVREALEPAMNAIFNITPSEGRKILNDAMDASGRAILREMFKRYVKFSKWSGV